MNILFMILHAYLQIILSCSFLFVIALLGFDINIMLVLFKKTAHLSLYFKKMLNL